MDADLKFCDEMNFEFVYWTSVFKFDGLKFKLEQSFSNICQQIHFFFPTRKLNRSCSI